MSFVKALISRTDLLIVFSFAITILLSLRMYPVIIYVNRNKNLMDVPDDRKIHKEGVPTHGGLGIFIAFTVAVLMTGLIKGLVPDDLLKVISLFLATLILFFFGLKDDLVGLAPRKKFAGQLIAAAIIIFFADIRIYSLEGIFGIDTLPYSVSLAFTIFVFLLIVNAYNLIDGIDGLAGSIAVLAGSCFGVFFLLNDQFLLSLVSFSMVAAVIGFLRFNLSDSKRLFMGDSGSMFLGLVLAWLGVEFLAVNRAAASEIAFSNAAMMLLAVLCYPLLDTLRVFIIRIGQGRSPFSADRYHIHHRLLRVGFTHRQATFYIVLTSLVTLWIVFSIQSLDVNLQLLIMVTLIPLLYITPFLRLRPRQKKSPEKQLEFVVERNEHRVPSSSTMQPFYTTKATKSRPEKAGEERLSAESVKPADESVRPTLADKRVEIYKKSKQNQEEIRKEDSQPKSE